MNAVNHIKEFFIFWKPSVARRITLYFAVFGLLIFYLTSLAYLVMSKKYLVNSVTNIVQAQISEIPGTDKPDAWWGLVDKKNPKLRSLAQTIKSLASSIHSVLDVSIYGRPSKSEPWYRLYLDKDDIVRAEPLDESVLRKVKLEDRKHFINSDSNLESNLYMRRRNIYMFVNITSPADKGEYFYKVVIDRQGVTCLMGNEVFNFIAISIGALLLFRIIGYFFAQRLAAPIETLSDAAAKVAEGDLSPQVPFLGKTEIGDLGRNFNKMIMGLREWQRIKRIEVEIEKGREIQQNFLPSEIPNLPNWEIATCFYPAKEVSGDFYDVFELPGGRLGLVIADVADKGVGSALYMALIRSLIRVYAEQTFARDSESASVKTNNSYSFSMDTGKREIGVVQLTNNYLVRHHGHDCMFATLFFGVLDPASGHLVYINGGHEPLYIIGKDGVKAELPPTGPAVGLMEDLKFTAQRLQFDPGDLLLGLTDGVTEACNPEEEFFTRNRVKDILAQPMASSRELLEKIRQQVFDFVDTAPRSDDFTMLAVQRMA
ncbi:MAG: SpoIIE family protein phosphatase [Thermodesulfobacteriota bacterium]